MSWRHPSLEYGRHGLLVDVWRFSPNILEDADLRGSLTGKFEFLLIGSRSRARPHSQRLVDIADPLATCKHFLNSLVDVEPCVLLVAVLDPEGCLLEFLPVVGHLSLRLVELEALALEATGRVDPLAFLRWTVIWIHFMWKYNNIKSLMKLCSYSCHFNGIIDHRHSHRLCRHSIVIVILAATESTTNGFHVLDIFIPEVLEVRGHGCPGHLECPYEVHCIPTLFGGEEGIGKTMVSSSSCSPMEGRC